MAFERFEKGEMGSSGATKELVSVRKSGTIGINEPALELFDDDVTNLDTLYDSENHLIALEESDDGYKISKNGSTATLGCNSFLKHHQLIPDITTRYVPEYKEVETEDGETLEALVIDLNESYDTYGSADSDEEE